MKLPKTLIVVLSPRYNEKRAHLSSTQDNDTLKKLSLSCLEWCISSAPWRAINSSMRALKAFSSPLQQPVFSNRFGSVSLKGSHAHFIKSKLPRRFPASSPHTLTRCLWKIAANGASTQKKGWVMNKWAVYLCSKKCSELESLKTELL